MMHSQRLGRNVNMQIRGQVTLNAQGGLRCRWSLLHTFRSAYTLLITEETNHVTLYRPKEHWFLPGIHTLVPWQNNHPRTILITINLAKLQSNLWSFLIREEQDWSLLAKDKVLSGHTTLTKKYYQQWTATAITMLKSKQAIKQRNKR